MVQIRVEALRQEKRRKVKINRRREKWSHLSFRGGIGERSLLTVQARSEETFKYSANLFNYITS